MWKLLIFILFLPTTAFASIKNFESEVRVNADGWLDVTETITVLVDGAVIKRGIYRDFPQLYQTKYGLKHRRPFEVTSVLRNGSPEPHRKIPHYGGSRLRIGHQNHFLKTGSIQIYEIQYRTNRQLILGNEGTDELSWNVTGNEWGLPIEKSSATIILPENISVKAVDSASGQADATERNAINEFSKNTATFVSQRVLAPGEGLTVSAIWATGQLSNEAYELPGFYGLEWLLFIGLLLCAVSLLLYFVLWFLHGRDPAAGVIVPRWEPPKGFSAAGMRYLRSASFDNSCFSAAIMELAATKYVRLNESGESFKLKKISKKVPDHPIQKLLFNKLLRPRNSLSLSNDNHTIVKKASAALQDSLSQKIDGAYHQSNMGQLFVASVIGVIGLTLTMFGTYQSLWCWVIFGILVILSWLARWPKGICSEANEVDCLKCGCLFFDFWALCLVGWMGACSYGIFVLSSLLIFFTLDQPTNSHGA